MEERHASWLELFFDLVFVVAIAELSLGLVRDHSLGGFGIFGGVRDRVFRVAMLAAMLAISALAVRIPEVGAGRHDAGFVIAYVCLRSLLIARLPGLIALEPRLRRT
jgi:hypothetical protein